MVDWEILHITDLHLSDPAAGSEHLRSKGYKEYVGQLIDLIQETDSKPTKIIATGDFVDWHKFENLPLASDILDFFCARLGLKRSDVAVCPGNHDFDWELDKSDQKKSREEFRKFAAQFANGSAVLSNQRACLSNMQDGSWCLSIDATFGCMGENHPGDLPVAAADDIIEMIGRVSDDELLVVATHYPVVTFESLAPYAGNEPNYYERHFWKSGQGLRERIRKKRRKAPTIWLCGDTHEPDHIKIDNIYFVMTGRLGTQVTKPSQVRRQAKIVRVGRTSFVGRARTFTFDPPGHVDLPDVGEWKQAESKFRQISDFMPDETPTLSGVTAGVRTSTTTKSQICPAELFNDSLEDQILNTIASRRLYSMGRFKTSENSVSLSWVSLGPLMNEAGIFALTIDRGAEWLRRKLVQFKIAHEEAILLGIDSWGAILAAQLSVVAGTLNLSLVSRTRGRHYSETEQLNDELIQQISSAKAVVLVSDVIATGASLRYVYDLIVAKGGSAISKWLAISVICDPSQPRFSDCSFLSAQGAACTGLKMPILGFGELPDEEILLPKISLVI